MDLSPRKTTLAKRLFSIEGLTLMVLLAGVAWRVGRYLLQFPIWGDEAFVAGSFFTRDYWSMIKPPLEYHQIAPLGFMWIELAMTRTLGFSELSLRLPAFLAGLTGLLLFWRLVRHIVDRRTVLLAVAMLAASFYHVRHGTELKPYAIDMLVALILSALAYRAVQCPKSVITWAALIGVAVVSVWLSYTAAFVIGGMGVYLAYSAATRRSGKMLAGLIALGVLAGGSFIAMYVLYAGPHAQANPHYFVHPMWRDSFPPMKQPWLLPWWLLKVHTGNMLAYPVGGNNFGSTATFILVALGCVSLWRRGRRDLLVLLLSPLAMNFIAAALRKYPYGTSARISLFMAPAFCLLAAVGLRSVLQYLVPVARRQLAVKIAAGVLAVVALGGLTINIIQPYKTLREQQTREFIRGIAARTLPGDRWLIVNSLSMDAVGPTLKGRGKQVFHFYVNTLAPAQLVWGADPAKLPLGNGATWLLCYQDPVYQEALPAQLQGQVQGLTDRLGPPKSETILLDREEDSVDHLPRIMANYFRPSATSQPSR